MQEASEALLLLQSTVTSVNNAREQQIEDEQQSDHEEVPAVSVMTEMSMSYISQLEEEVQKLCEDNQQLKDALESERLTEKAFKPFLLTRLKIL